MNKSELINAIALSSGESKAATERVLSGFASVAESELAAGKDVAIAGFGIFKVSDRAARKGRNPQTGAEIDIPASKGVKFSAGKALKEAVNGK